MTYAGTCGRSELCSAQASAMAATLLRLLQRLVLLFPLKNSLVICRLNTENEVENEVPEILDVVDSNAWITRVFTI